MKCLFLVPNEAITTQINGNLLFVVWNLVTNLIKTDELILILLHKNKMSTDNDSTIPLYNSIFLRLYTKETPKKF